MSAIATPTTASRVAIIDDWAVLDLPGGDQVRGRFVNTPETYAPERPEGIHIAFDRGGYGEPASIDQHDGFDAIKERISWCQDCYSRVITREGRAFDEGCGWHVPAHTFDLDDFIARYLRTFWDVTEAVPFSHQGYTQSDWADVWLIVDADAAVPAGTTCIGFVEEWSAWAKGDSYRIEIETRSLMEALKGEGWTPDEDWSYTAHGEEAAQAVLADAMSCEGVALAASDVPTPHGLA